MFLEFVRSVFKMRYRIPDIRGNYVFPILQIPGVRVPRMRMIVLLVFFFLILSFFASCGQPEAVTPSQPSTQIRVDLEKSDERKLLAFYIGGMLSEDGSDPFESGFVLERNDSFFLDATRFSELLPELASDIKTAGADGRIRRRGRGACRVPCSVGR